MKYQIIFMIIGNVFCCAFGDGPEENDNMYEGDMTLSPQQLLELKTFGVNPQIPLAAINTREWPLTIPYEVDKSLSDKPDAVSAITEAIKEYEKHTCLRFRKRSRDKEYMSFYYGTGCFSDVGSNKQKTSISLGYRCWTKGTAIHEIGHALGFYHEQSRPDRDTYVKIIYENIMKGMKLNFSKKSTKSIDSLGFPYDYDSIMHYGEKAFSKNGNRTVETLNSAYQSRIGQRTGLSRIDIEQINKLYQCKTENICQGSSKKIYCRYPKTIQIRNVFYGYSFASDHLTNRRQCNNANRRPSSTVCSSPYALGTIKRSCDRKRSCQLTADQTMGRIFSLNRQSCKGYKFYLNVFYGCTK